MRPGFLSKYILKCPRCGFETEASPYVMRCPRCGELLDALLIADRVRLNWGGGLRGGRGGVWRYRELLPEPSSIVTMGEGVTPLIKLRGHGNAYVKFEGANPTGSFKDRGGMTIGVSLALSIGVKGGVIVASTGNTAASAAATRLGRALSAWWFCRRVVLPRASWGRRCCMVRGLPRSLAHSIMRWSTY